MSEPDDCTCEGNALNERLKGRANYHDEEGLMPPNSIDDEGYVKMEGKNIGKIIGKFIAQAEPSDSDRMTDAEYDKAMELLKEIHEACPTPEKIGKINYQTWKSPAERTACVGGDSMCPCQDGDPCHYEGGDAMKIPYNPEKIERGILSELSELRQKVADLETAKAFHVSIYENIIQRLNDAEDKVRIMDRVIGSLELQRLRGNG